MQRYTHTYGVTGRYTVLYTFIHCYVIIAHSSLFHHVMLVTLPGLQYESPYLSDLSYATSTILDRSIIRPLVCLKLHIHSALTHWNIW